MGDLNSSNSNPKGYTPGWNDPPLFSYDSQAAHSNAPRKANTLTKRVAFPMQSSSNSTVNKHTIDPTAPPSLNSNLPPPPGSRVPPITNCDNYKQDSSEGENASNLSKGEALSKVLSNVELVIGELSSNKSFLEQVEDIQKKLDLLKKMWNEDKLLTDIHDKIYKLTNALVSKDIKTANHLQVGLMVDHASVCSSWISAFRLLIRFRSDEHL